MQPSLKIRKAAVLGAGVMGAQIAAHLVNANVEAVLFDLPSKEGDPNDIVRKAIDNLKKLEPSPLSVASKADYIQPANYDRDMTLLKDCDLVIEAISERMDWKRALYEKVAPHLSDRAVFASNTSGLSINALAQALPEALRARFCGMHFFNPPRYMHLVELIPGRGTRPDILDGLEAFLVTALGKGVVRAKDTPNFIANRVGVFSILAAFHHTERLGLGFDEVDALTGPLIGRPKSATYRTADVVGLDTLAHVINTMKETLPDDPWHRYYEAPGWLRRLLEEKAFGQKSGRGVYRKVGKDIQVLNLGDGNYRLSGKQADDGVVEILKNKNVAERFAQLRANRHPQAQFLWAAFRDSLHYCAYHLQEIADNARDVDFAVRWGFGWDRGPFEIWQSAGWPQVAAWICEDIATGKAMSNAPLPAWALEAERAGVHTANGSYSPATRSYQPRPTLPIYRRQPFPDRLISEPAAYGSSVFETDAVRLWTTGDDIAVLSFKSKMHAIGEDVLDGIAQAIEEAERGFKGLVIWQTEPPFSVGANLSGGSNRKPDQKPSAFASMMKKFRREAESAILKAARKLNVADALMAGRLEKVEQMVEQFQATSLALRYSMVPTVAAVDGMALGGGCEFVMHCDRAVASLESYIGLVEVGVGLIPAGGGCKELALRAADEAKGEDVFPLLKRYFQNVATAQVGRSAEHSRELGYLHPADRVVMNRFELLHAAKAELNAMHEAGYRPPLRRRNIPCAGRSAIATLKMGMTNLLAGRHISEHDYLVGSKLAYVMCGGDVEPGSLVDEQWFLDLERRAFIELLATEKTQARIEHMLKTGKPLRN
ncbi:MAG TPA: 3-hydroxyacyl-CoA dehydrogenase NAD-binding domain-containing protein [Burkholderiales bacterium]|jgi:3-hydroxyacyl-CoA dehydrogenase|nr:3-hydroxyacyl-CoA dehydrogenase NAD-binding domain-containing protein [Burkholderiales bacterium]